MSEQLNWHLEGDQLFLSGKLEQQTLIALWQQREIIMTQVSIINVSALERVDTAGLALLVHLRQIALDKGLKLCFTGITEKLRTLILLYNLPQIITSHS
ncbi:lipid asymmetry maintenance protein MlaB [Erwinia tracheiphila]|uniref:Anti-sigma B factor antagonist n=1 Tax=Erwinia tracheiphila TaxID=65700 RepID=A0A0M2KK09_9GAMM|nr:lipid asymmetry maintenance protein MlaB [Erwinia tracheiphila]AXF78284.1 lipid asymmetry maintenance protein MlaB [Erwinia tracheiphila]EOS95641.1 Anti-sigma B factor antagonist [Erwinia tracheiphila PSU-1]KKF37346.1 anti-sigma B factor antagonist [Erwinia tracheiphila]UIA82991.1 lipid asymmetry maintenance protein MlaB [Erwinia tracheiphila]UIA88740.1 lipid asymmetry maintenance protein MlaB [Erwinia tracheiphila]